MSRIWHCPNSVFRFFSVFISLGYSVDFFFSLPHLFGLFGARLSIHHPDLLCYISYILKVLLSPSHCLLCLAFVFLHLYSFFPFPIRLARHCVLHPISPPLLLLFFTCSWLSFFLPLFPSCYFV